MPNTWRLSSRARPRSRSASADFGVDHRQEAVRHLGEAVADVAHRGAERAEDLVLLLEQLHQVEGDRRPRGRAAGDEAAAALEHKQRAVEAFAADVLEHHVDALLVGELARDRLEPLLAVVDDVIGAERLGLCGLLVVADRGDDGAADRLGHLDRDRADAGAAGLHQDGLARLRAWRCRTACARRSKTRSARRRRRAWLTPLRHRDDEPRRQVQPVAREAVDVEAHDAGDVFAQIVAALAAGLAGAAGQRAVHHHRIAGLERRVTPSPTAAISPAASAPTTSGSLRLANAMPRKPQTSMWLSATALTAICTSPAAGGGGAGTSAQFELAVRNQRQRAHRSRHAGSRPITSDTFCPPKPNELEMAWRILASRAAFGTTSSGIAGSGTW